MYDYNVHQYSNTGKIGKKAECTLVLLLATSQPKQYRSLSSLWYLIYGTSTWGIHLEHTVFVSCCRQFLKNDNQYIYMSIFGSHQMRYIPPATCLMRAIAEASARPMRYFPISILRRQQTVTTVLVMRHACCIIHTINRTPRF